MKNSLGNSNETIGGHVMSLRNDEEPFQKALELSRAH